MIPVLEHPWCQAFYRIHKHFKEQGLVNFKNVQINRYLEIYYLLENL